MLFPTIEFAVFFAVVFAVSWALNRYNTTKKSLLVLASYFFYAFWKLAYVLVLFLSSTANYGLALLLGRMQDGPLRRLVFWLGVAGNLAVLGVFKYYDFFVAQAMTASWWLFGIRPNIAFLELGIPVAISFLTFHALSYIIDVYNRTGLYPLPLPSGLGTRSGRRPAGRDHTLPRVPIAVRRGASEVGGDRPVDARAGREYSWCQLF